MKEQVSCFLRKQGSVGWDKMQSTEGSMTLGRRKGSSSFKEGGKVRRPLTRQQLRKWKKKQERK